MTETKKKGHGDGRILPPTTAPLCSSIPTRAGPQSARYHPAQIASAAARNQKNADGRREGAKLMLAIMKLPQDDLEEGPLREAIGLIITGETEKLHRRIPASVLAMIDTSPYDHMTTAELFDAYYHAMWASSWKREDYCWSYTAAHVARPAITEETAAPPPRDLKAVQPLPWGYEPISRNGDILARVVEDFLAGKARHPARRWLAVSLVAGLLHARAAAADKANRRNRAGKCGGWVEIRRAWGRDASKNPGGLSQNALRLAIRELLSKLEAERLMETREVPGACLEKRNGRAIGCPVWVRATDSLMAVARYWEVVKLPRHFVLNPESKPVSKTVYSPEEAERQRRMKREAAARRKARGRPETPEERRARQVAHAAAMRAARVARRDERLAEAAVTGKPVSHRADPGKRAKRRWKPRNG